MGIINNFLMNAEESINQSNTFTKLHKRYDIEIIMFVNLKSNEKQEKMKKLKNKEYRKITFEYQCSPKRCNPKYSKPNIKDCLYSIIMDAQSYENSDDDIQNFAYDFGYTDVNECIKAFNGCKKIYNDIVENFGEKTYRLLCKYFENY